jgi:pimeloyl-ACP methyl ester carboxylesterase
MKEKKKMFLIPGFGQNTNEEYFYWLVDLLKKKGFDVVGVPITWNRRIMSDYINEFKIFFEKNKSKNNYFFGFSYGSVIAISTATELKPKKIYLCSLSPDFKEDVVNLKPWLQKLVGKKRIKNSMTRSGREIAKNLTVPVVLFYGEQEGKKFPDLKKRAEETARLAKNAKVILVKDAPHDLSHPEYMKAIKKEFK